jgi:hypothetical protein
MKPQSIVTVEFLQERISTNPSKTIGRALLAIYNLQTTDEQQSNTTELLNGIGFTAFDASLGSRCAEFFKVNGYLKQWMIDCWKKPIGKKGIPKVCKYVKQLNQIAYVNQSSTARRNIS